MVTLIDINDNLPEFAATSTTTVTLAEDAPGMEVAAFDVSDLDVDPEFFFTLADDGGPFSITSIGNTGCVLYVDKYIMCLIILVIIYLSDIQYRQPTPFAITTIT